MADSRTHYSKTTLLSRGWTSAMITKLVGEPDKVWRAGHCTCYFAKEVVHAAEQSDAFAASKKQAGERMSSQHAAHDTRRTATLSAAAAAEFSVPRMEVAELTRRAIEAYNRTVTNPALRATKHSGPTFLAYLSLHWLRRQNTEYARAVVATRRQPGRWEAYYCLRARLLDAIETAYPHLSEECAELRARQYSPDERVGLTVEWLEEYDPDPDAVSLRFAARRKEARAREAGARQS